MAWDADGACYGDERTRTRFAWLPVKLDDGRWVHLQWFTAIERLEEGDGSGWQSSGWVRIRAHQADLKE